MSDTKQFVFEETLRNVHPQYGPGYAIVNGTDNVSHTASGPGGAWTVSYGSNQGRSSNTALFSKELTNSSGNSETITIPWGDGFQNMLTSKNGVPATKCRIDVANGVLRTAINISYGYWSSVTNGQKDPFPVRYDWSITEEVNGTDQITAKSISDNLPQRTVGGVAGGNNAPFEIREFNLDTGHYIQGSGVTGGEANSLSSLSTAFRVGSYNTPGTFNNWYFGYLPYVAITATRSWEGNLYIIDGLNNDTVDFNQVTATLTCQAGIRQQAEADLTAEFTNDEQSKNLKIIPSQSFSQSFEISIAPSFKLGIDEDISTKANLIASTANLKLADAALQANATQASDAHIIFGITDQLTAQVATSTSAGLIYDITGDYTWDSFNLNSYFEPGYSIDNFALDEGEYTWNFLADADWDSWPVSTWLGNEQTWDNWPDDVWETPYIVGMAASVIISPAFKLGDVVSYTGTFTFDEDSAFEKASQADLTAQFTTEFTASGVIDVEADLSGAFAPSLNANIIYDLEDTPITITGAFTPVLTANAITDTFADIDVSASISITPTFKPAGESVISAATELDLAPTFKPAGLAALTALASTLQVARLFYQADPYNIIKVAQENRVVLVPTENRQTLVMEENRVNIVGAETRAYEVPQETRRIKLRIPPYSNRFSTPRVRSSQ